LAIPVLSQSRLKIQRDSELGKVVINLSQLPLNDKVEEWMPLVPMSVSDYDTPSKDSELGALRVKITFSVPFLSFLLLSFPFSFTPRLNPKT